MKINDSSRQFIKDGLVGVALASLVFLILTSVIWNSGIFAGHFFDYIHLMFFVSRTPYVGYLLGPMPIVMLTAFISVGLVGRFLETNSPEKKWIMLVVKISGISFLVGFGLSVIYGIFSHILYILYFGFVGAIGAMLALLIGILGGAIFNPQKRLYKIIIGAIPSVLVGYSIGFLILILIVTPSD